MPNIVEFKDAEKGNNILKLKEGNKYYRYDDGKPPFTLRVKHNKNISKTIIEIDYRNDNKIIIDKTIDSTKLGEKLISIFDTKKSELRWRYFEGSEELKHGTFPDFLQEIFNEKGKSSMEKIYLLMDYLKITNHRKLNLLTIETHTKEREVNIYAQH